MSASTSESVSDTYIQWIREPVSEAACQYYFGNPINGSANSVSDSHPGQWAGKPPSESASGPVNQWSGQQVSSRVSVRPAAIAT